MMIKIFFGLLALSVLAISAASVSSKNESRAPMSSPFMKGSPEGPALSDLLSSSSTPESDITTSSPTIAAPTIPAVENTTSETGPKTLAPSPKEVFPPASPPPAANPKKSDSLYGAAEKARAALVNIRCTSDSIVVPGATGSGVIIDPKGIVVTNAHVAQYFLIAQMMPQTTCHIRTGSPAKVAFDAKLIFISPQWLARNALSFSNSYPAVNGAFDYAFLGITKSLTKDPLPQAFPYVPFALDEAYLGENVVIAGYAAEFLDEIQIDSTLSPTLAFGSVSLLSSFSESHPDLLELGSNAAAQRGSSGGGIVNGAGVLRGVLTIGSALATSTEREFAAISTDYIRRTYEKEEGTSLDRLLEADPLASISAFRWRGEELAEPLMKNLHNPDPWDIYPW